MAHGPLVHIVFTKTPSKIFIPNSVTKRFISKLLIGLFSNEIIIYFFFNSWYPSAWP